MSASGVNVIRRLVFAVAVVLGVACWAGSASAYPPGGSSVATSASVYQPGDHVVVTASMFDECAGEDIVFTITARDGSGVITLHATIGADGTAHVTFAAGTAGGYTVSAEAGCGWATTSFSVQAAKPLPHAGSDTAPVLLVAGALFVSGVGFLFVAWRRREHDRGRR